MSADRSATAVFDRNADAPFPLSPADAARLERNFPVLPKALCAILEVVDADVMDLEALSKKLAVDPVVAAKMLRMANSSFYGCSGRVSSLRDAIAVLGLSSVRGLVLALTMSKQFGSLPRDVFDYQAAWSRCLWSAMIADGLARKVGANPDTWFTAAILQDLGQCALACAFPTRYRKVALVLAGDPQADVIALERHIIGMDHATFGADIMTQWNLGPEIARAVGSHHGEHLNGSIDAATGIRLANRLIAADRDSLQSDISGWPMSVEALHELVLETYRDHQNMERATAA